MTILFSGQTMQGLSVGGSWYKLNLGQTVPCRVAYPSSNLVLIQKALTADISVLPAIDRAGLLDDVWSLANAEVIEASDALSLSQFLVAETDAIVWGIAARKLLDISDLMAGSTGLPQFQSFVLGLMAPCMSQFANWTTVDPSTHMGKLLEATLLKTAIFLGDQTTLTKAKALFDALQADPNMVINPDILSSVYTAGAIAGDESDYDWLMQKYLTSSFATEKQTLLQALAFTQK